MPKKRVGVVPVVGIVSHFRLDASFFVVDVRILPLATRKSTRRASAAVRKLSNERYGGRPILARSNVDSAFNIRYCLEIIFARLFSPRVLTRTLLVFTNQATDHSNANINMQSNEPRYAIVNNS